MAIDDYEDEHEQITIVYNGCSAKITLNLCDTDDTVIPYVTEKLSSIPRYITEITIDAENVCDICLGDSNVDVLSLLPSHIKKLTVSCSDSCDTVPGFGTNLPSGLEIIDMDYPYEFEAVMDELPASIHTIRWGYRGYIASEDVLRCLDRIPEHVKRIELCAYTYNGERDTPEDCLYILDSIVDANADDTDDNNDGLYTRRNFILERPFDLKYKL